MAVPKRRTSRTRKNRRRAHQKTKAPAMVECPQCREMKLPHRVCLHCGYYKGKEVVEVD